MKIIAIIIDALFPPRTTELCVRSLSETAVSALYRKQKVYECTYLSQYRNSTVSALITENKFYANKKAMRLLAGLLTKWLEEITEPVCFIPIPLSQARERERGYNQILEVVREAKRECDRIDTNLITRAKNTAPQVSLNREKRLYNIKNAFKGNGERLGTLRDVTVVLIDDVYTTGATMHAARAKLAPHLHPSVKLICLVLAH